MRYGPGALGLTCLIIVCFLDEEELLPTFLASMEQQTRRPDRLLLVDDGSRDRSYELCSAWAAERPWVEAVQRPKRPPAKDRLAGAPEFTAFKSALDEHARDEEVVVKMDADLELSPVHVATVLAALEEDPRLGIAGTYLSVRRPDGSTEREPHPAQHVRGPTRFYRRACWDEIAPMPAIIGWDGADGVRARARGWTTRSLDVQPPSLHLRPTGQHDGRLRAFARWGEAAYATGLHPLGVLAGAVIRLRQRPMVLGGASYVAGWALARRRGIPRFPEDIRRASRTENLRRLRGGRSRLRQDD